MHRWKMLLVAMLSAGGMSACGGGVVADADADCSAYLDEKPLGNARFTLKNHRAESIYLDIGACSSSLQIQEPGGKPQSTTGDARWDVTCQDKQKERELAADCIVPTAIEIGPGGDAFVPWNGLVDESVEMPNECYGKVSGLPLKEPGLSSCNQGKAPKAGPLQAVFKLYQTFVGCSDPFSCNYGKDPYTIVSPTFNYPSDTEVQVDVN